MSEFEKELEKFNLENGTDYRKLNQYSDVLTTHFKDWQPPKQLVEVPQIVARYIETQKDNNYNGSAYLIVKHYDSFKDEGNDSELNIWIANNFNDFLSAIVNGYTVKKEPLYALEFPKQLNSFVAYTVKNQDDEVIISGYTSIKKGAKRFTEAEIKAIDERYWAFAVKVDEV